MSPPPSPGWTLLKLAIASLLMGLLLVSLDITPSSLLAMAEDAGSSLEQWGKSIGRAAEIVLGCLLAGGALVLPYWLVQRVRKKSRPSLAAVAEKPRQVASDPAALVPPTDPAKTAPALKTP
jgi:hypothetical protein